MKFLFLALLAATAYASSDGTPTDGESRLASFTIGGASCDGSFGASLAITMVELIGATAADVTVSGCTPTERRRLATGATFDLKVENMNPDQLAKLNAIVADSAAFEAALRTREAFDSFMVTLSMIVVAPDTPELPCMGGSLYIGEMEFTMTEGASKDPRYVNGESVIFVKDGAWMYQGADADPTDATGMFSCMKSVPGTECSMYEDMLAEKDAKIMELNGKLATCSTDGGYSCSDNLREPVDIINKAGAVEWWFCDELLPSDCDNKGVPQMCPALCGTCGSIKEEDKCDEKYHTKVFVTGTGSLYCDQLYPEECAIELGGKDADAGAKTVADICCQTCN